MNELLRGKRNYCQFQSFLFNISKLLGVYKIHPVVASKHNFHGVGVDLMVKSVVLTM